jgi:hypothetical protein
MTIKMLSVEQLTRAMEIEMKIGALKAELAAVLSGAGTVTPAAVSSATNFSNNDARRGKRSAATRAKMAAAQKARWAQAKGGAAAAPAAPRAKGKKKRTMSPEARARIAAAQKRRWAAVRAGK